MTTIHIQSDEAAVIAQIVQYLLGLGKRVRFHGDNDDSFDAMTDWDDNFVSATEAARRLMAEVEAHQHERALERFTARREQWERDHQNYELNVSVPCGYCHAQANDHCVTARGAKCERPFVHAVRKHDAWKAECAAEDLRKPVPVIPEWIGNRITLDEV
jgi:hypothetical protein